MRKWATHIGISYCLKMVIAWVFRINFLRGVNLDYHIHLELSDLEHLSRTYLLLTSLQQEWLAYFILIKAFNSFEFFPKLLKNQATSALRWNIIEIMGLMSKDVSKSQEWLKIIYKAFGGDSYIAGNFYFWQTKPYS